MDPPTVSQSRPDVATAHQKRVGLETLRVCVFVRVRVRMRVRVCVCVCPVCVASTCRRPSPSVCPAPSHDMYLVWLGGFAKHCMSVRAPGLGGSDSGVVIGVVVVVVR
jgi:hypothetical protein